MTTSVVVVAEVVVLPLMVQRVVEEELQFSASHLGEEVVFSGLHLKYMYLEALEKEELASNFLFGERFD